MHGQLKKSSWAVVCCTRYYVVHNFSAQMHACMRTIYRHFTNKLPPPWWSLPSPVRVFTLDPYPVAVPLCSPRQWSDGLSEGLSSLPSPSKAGLWTRQQSLCISTLDRKHLGTPAMLEYFMCFHYSRCYCWKLLCLYEMACVKVSGLWKGIVDSSPSLEDDC